jgi:hypothetical protein
MGGGSPGASAAIKEGSPGTGTLPWFDVRMGLGAMRDMPDEQDGSAEAGATMGGGLPSPMRGGSLCRDKEIGGFEEDVVEIRIDFVEWGLFGFFLVRVPSEVGRFLFGLKTALGWHSAWTRVGGAARVVGDGGK